MTRDLLIFLRKAPKAWVIFLLFSLGISASASAQCLWYPDNDQDGFGAPVAGVSAPCNAGPAGMVANNQDCNDNSPNIAAWAPVGGVSASSRIVVSSKIRIAPDGTPYILYQWYTDPDPRVLISVRKFNGTGWVPMGGDPIGISDYMLNADLAVDAAGVPYVSFVDADQGNRVSVIRYDAGGDVWTALGGRGFSPDDVVTNGQANIAIDKNNVPYIFYANNAYDGTVMRYDASSSGWQNVGGGPVATGMGSSEYGLAIDGAGIPYVVFTESDTEISVMRFVGGSWQVVGARSFSDNYVMSPQLVLGSNNVPYVAYLDGSVPVEEVIVQRYDAGVGAWVKVGAPVYVGYTELSLAVDLLGAPYVAYNGTGNITVARWGGASWQTVADAEFANGINLSLVVSPRNVPYISCKDLVESDNAVVRKVTPMTVGPGVPTLASTKSSVCAGETTRLSVSAGSLHDATAWTWYATGCGAGTALGTGTTLDVSPTVTTTYYARGEGSCVPPGLCGQITINITTSPTTPTLAATRSSVCPNGSTTLSIATGTLGAATQHWTWYETTCGDAAKRLGDGAQMTVNPAVTTTYYARGEGSCVGACGSITIQVIGLPIATAPASATSVCGGSNGVLAVTPVSNVASYQWRVSAGAGSWTDLPGETSATLSRAPGDLQAYPAENVYSVLLKNSIGCEQAVTTNLKILSLAPPVIAAAGDPVDVSVCGGTDAVFTITMSSGAGLSYQWQESRNGAPFADVSNGGVYSGATTTSLRVAGAPPALHGGKYRIVVSNAACSPVTSNGLATLNVLESTLTIGQQPVEASTCAGGSSTFAVAVVGTDLVYQWQEAIGATFTDITDNAVYAGATTSALTISNATESMNGRRYRVVVSHARCGTSVTSDGLAALVIAAGGVEILTDPTNMTICQGEGIIFQVSAQGTRLAYQWQVSTDGTSFSDITDQEAGYAGATTNTLVVTASAFMNGYRYRAVVSNGGCASSTSEAGVLTVSTTPGEAGCPYELLVSEGVSPNGDGILDYWVILGIERYPANRVKIYNVWGDLVFESNGYANEVLAWRGESNRGATLAGSQAPDGTYYYTIDLGDGNGKDSILNGFVVLKR